MRREESATGAAIGGAAADLGLPGARPRRPGLVWVVLMLAALGAGTVAWLGGEALLDRFRPDEKASSERFVFAEFSRQLAIATTNNAAAAFGLLGAALGVTLGVAGGWVRRSRGAAVGAGLVGLVLGGGAGVLASFGLMPVYSEHKDPSGTDLGQAILFHGGLWGSLGLAGGLAFGLGRHGMRPGPVLVAAVGGLVGALVGTFVFEVVGALGFPFARTTEPISASASTRLLARLAVAVGTALGASLSRRV